VAMEDHETARAIRESLPRSAKRDLALAQTWTAIGDCRYVGAPYKPRPRMRGTAQQAYEAALATLIEIQPAPELRAQVLFELGRAHQRLGGFYSGVKLRDLPRAIRHHDAALSALGKLSAMNPGDAVARRNYADQLVMKATAHNTMSDGAAAVEATDRALKVLHEFAAADPKNVEGQHDLAFAYGEKGLGLMHMGRLAEAEQALTEAVKIRERLLAADPSKREVQRDLGRVQAALAEVRRRQ
jgi:tetratricopeptide (TPR) repeat protein